MPPTSTLDSDDASPTSVTPRSGIVITVTHDPAINYAFQQNAIPVIRELVIRNDDVSRKDLKICLRTDPPFATPIELNVQSLEANAEFRVAPLDLKLNPSFLASLNEKVSGCLYIDLLAGDAIIAQLIQPISLLAKNEWSGLDSLPEILAAFVLPNDPAVMTILSRASQILGEHTGRSAFNGYQDKSRKRAWEQLAAIYQAIAELGIRYIAPPASFENTGQKIRFPSDILAQRFATCLDLVLLVSACCEQAGMHPLVLMHEGHAYAGCWLEDRTLEEPVIDDLQRIRKLVEVEAISALETTSLASESPGTLQDAERSALPHLTTTLPFRLALDIRRARVSRIHPLAVLEASTQPAPIPTPADASLSPSLGERAFTEPVITPKVTPRHFTRIDQWKSRLLDLSLRNRLLNFKPTKSTIPILSTVPEQIEDTLAAAAELSIQPKPKLMGENDPRNPAVYTEQQKTDWLTAFLKDELAQNRLHTSLDEPEHTRRVTELYRAARLALEENGTNTLFAAIGVLEWRETEHADRILRAPLLLVPVELKRKSILEGFILRRVDEDSRLNVTLMEMLRQQFQKEVSGLDPLPEDENGVNVTQVLQIFREAVRDLPGWEVKTEIWLGQFSFTKFLLWKDLSDRLDALTENRVVRHLVQESGITYPNPPEDVVPTQLDQQFHPREIFCPRSADSSQLAAVMAAAKGHDFVLEGPPGTGKSQTITNIISHCLATGKRVLFVAEKRAALDVVHRRLKEEGLEPFCLELHSNKAGKADVLAQFNQSLKFVASIKDTTWERKAAEVEQLRASLNEYTRVLHQKHPCDLSAFDCFDYLLPRQHEETVRFTEWNKILEISSDTLARARELTVLLKERSHPLGDLATHPLRLVRREEWSPSWAETTLEQSQRSLPVIQKASGAAADLCQWIKFPRPSATLAELDCVDALAETLLAAERVTPRFIEIALTPSIGTDNSSGARWDSASEEFKKTAGLLAERESLRETLKDYAEERLLALDLAALQTTWSAGESAWFLMRMLRFGQVRRQLGTAHKQNYKPDSETSPRLLKAALRLKEINSLIVERSQRFSDLLGALWRNGSVSSTDLERIRLWGDSLHTRAMSCAGHDGKWLTELRGVLAPLFNDHLAFRTDSSERQLWQHFRDSYRLFNESMAILASELRLNLEPLKNSAAYLTAIVQTVTGIIGAWPQLRFWTSWQRARHEAVTLNLAPIISHLEQSAGNPPDLAALFERSFRRAFLFAVIEQEKVLREFFGHEQEERIEAFRKLDDKIASLTREVIQARLAAKIPRDQSENDIPKTELGLLRKEIGKKTRHLPVRQLLNRIPNLLPCLKPCVLMSPLSVAQYLEPSHKLFDVVIFDEASQIPVWDSIGAIARGAQLIVVGDPKQLPPTNFFNRTEDAEEEEEVEFEDLESILDELLTHGLRHKRLQWHYRSRHEGLIAFSNRHYYENDLLTFPSPETGLGGVRLVYLPDARYDKGRSRTNASEARALVDELIRRLREKSARSYGVVTFSQAQQQLIENMLDEERRKYPDIEIHFSDEPPVEGEPVFVKNLESVQGDERDVILFSIGYGLDDSGRISMNFGPLNREGGERRLNVAITRAKHEVIVFSGLRGEQIDLTRTRARGVSDLKHFLEYAERGPQALVAPVKSSADPESSSGFADVVAEALRTQGFQVHRQVGCSGYRIDLAVVDPESPGKYLLGIECDGETYQRAATARDRDKLRHLILSGLGWTIHRVWSVDWWHDRSQQSAKLLQAIEAARRKRR